MKNLLLGILLCSASFLVGQPTLTMSDIGHQIGDALVLDSVDYMDLSEETGANMSWNLSDVTGYGWVFEMDILSPSGLPGSGLFPNSNMVRKVSFLGLEFFQYLKTSSNQIEYVGNYFSALNLDSYTVHSDPEIYIETPLTYGSMYTDTYQNELTSFGTSTTSGYSESEVVGFGTLLLGDILYQNALLLRVQRWDTLVSTVNNMDINTYSYDDVYSFLNFEFRYPLATFGAHTIATDGEPTETNYDGSILLTQSISTGINELAQTETEIEIYPNPVSNSDINVNFTLQSADNISISLFDVQGKLIVNLRNEQAYAAGENNVALKLPESIEAGVYLIHIEGDKLSETEKITVSQK